MNHLKERDTHKLSLSQLAKFKRGSSFEWFGDRGAMGKKAP